MASQVSVIRQHIAENHPLLAEVFGKHGLDELLNLIEAVVNSKLDEIKRDTEQQGRQLGSS